MKYIIPVIFISVMLYAAIKKVPLFSSFSRGVKEAVTFTVSLIPTLVCVFIMCELFERSGLAETMTKALSPLFGALGVPEGLTKLVLIKPFSGSGSLAYLTKILEEYGADSYISRCACVLYGSSETVFYISAVYFAGCRKKRRLIPIVIILLATTLTTVIACLLCRIM